MDMSTGPQELSDRSPRDELLIQTPDDSVWTPEAAMENPDKSVRTDVSPSGHLGAEGENSETPLGLGVATVPPTKSHPLQVFKSGSNTHVPPIPFPRRFATKKKEHSDKDILEVLSKVQVNIPLLDTIKQIPRYAKFIKDLCTNKRKLDEAKFIAISEEASTVL